MVEENVEMRRWRARERLPPKESPEKIIFEAGTGGLREPGGGWRR